MKVITAIRDNKIPKELKELPNAKV